VRINASDSYQTMQYHNSEDYRISLHLRENIKLKCEVLIKQIKWNSEAWAIVVHKKIEVVEIVTLKFLAGYA
jgi:hypothetical protein